MSVCLVLIRGCFSLLVCLVLSPVEPGLLLCEAGSLSAPAAGARLLIHNRKKKGLGQGREGQGLRKGGLRQPMRSFLTRWIVFRVHTAFTHPVQATWVF